MRLETRNSLHSRMHFKLHVPAKGQSCSKGQAAMLSTTLYMVLYILVCIFLVVRKDQKTNHVNYGIVQLKWPGLQLALVVGKGAAPNSTANCYFCNPTTTFHTEPTPRQLFLLLYPKPNHSETSLQAPGQPERIHQAQGRRGNPFSSLLILCPCCSGSKDCVV